MKRLLLILLIFFIPLINASIGIDYNVENNTYKIWNNKDIYYIENGIQLSNHINEYWSHNTVCFHVKPTASSNWIKKCTDELLMDWNATTDNLTYAKLKGEKIYIQGNYSFGLRLIYYLEPDYELIKIEPYIKNFGNSVIDSFISLTIDDIKISDNYENDVFDVSIWQPDGNNVIKRFDLNKEGLSVYYNYLDIATPEYNLIDLQTREYAKLVWDKNGVKNGSEITLQYDLNIFDTLSQANANVKQRFKIGVMQTNDYVSGILWWRDANDQYFGSEFLSNDPIETCRLDNATIWQKWAGIFTAKNNNKQINLLGIQLAGNFGRSPTYNYGIQALDGSGNPTGVWITRQPKAFKTISGWYAFAVPSVYDGIDANLTSGLKYALVIDWNSGTMDSANYISPANLPESIDLVPVDNSVDANYDVQCKDSFGYWYSMEVDPIFLICYTDGNCEGQPYNNWTGFSIASYQMAGEQFKVKSGNVDYNKVEIWASCCMSHVYEPAGDLNMVLENVTQGTQDFNQVICKPAVCGDTPYKWWQITFPSTMTLYDGNVYRLWVKAVDANLAVPYVINYISVNGDANAISMSWFGKDGNYIFSVNSIYVPIWNGMESWDFKGFRFQRVLPIPSLIKKKDYGSIHFVNPFKLSLGKQLNIFDGIILLFRSMWFK